MRIEGRIVLGKSEDRSDYQHSLIISCDACKEARDLQATKKMAVTVVFLVYPTTLVVRRDRATA